MATNTRIKINILGRAQHMEPQSVSIETKSV